MSKPRTNIQLVRDMMSFSKAGSLKQAFIIEAIMRYSEQTLEAEPWGKNSLINQEAWKQCASECIQAIENRK